MPDTIMPFLLLHFMCNALAAEQPLNHADAATCSSAYHQVKLEMAGGLEDEDYRQLDVVDRAAVMRLGYQNYREWRQDNPDTVARMEQEAQLRLSGTQAAQVDHPQ